MNNSYKKERIKLTILYFGIILFIITIFSGIVIHTQNQQFRRFEEFQNDIDASPRGRRMLPSQDEIDYVNDIIAEIKYQNLRTITGFDIILLLFATFLSYYLSGKTLEPIVRTLDKQKRFVSDASHELKTPLTNIKTEAEVLNRSKKSTIEEYKEFTSNVIEDVNRLDELVIYMLDNARMENLTSKINKSNIDLVQLTKDTAKRFEKRAKEKGIDISVNTEVDQIEVSTDPNLMQRLLSILIDNAIKYNKESGKTMIRTSVNSKKNAVIEVEDTGIGIPSTDIPKIFDRFYRASEDRNEKGFGLGLSIAKQLASELNLDLQVKSEEGKGSTFSLVFN